MNVLTLVLLLIVSSCALEIPEEEGFKYTFENTRFRQIKYRGTGDSAWLTHQGLRTINPKPGSIIGKFNNYREIGNGVFCFGEYEGLMTYYSADEFFSLIRAEDIENGGNGNNYDIFLPWNPVENTPPVGDEEVAEVADYYIIIKTNKNSVTPGCSVQVESELFAHFTLYTNGDLIYRDYNRGIEFFLRPM